jgi:hypothetical protein
LGKQINPGLIQQLWKVAFKIWQHGNTWQNYESKPENGCHHHALDQLIESAFCQGTLLVLKEHQHLFHMTLANGQLLPLSDKVTWLEFVQLAQRRAQAHLGFKKKLGDASKHGPGPVFLIQLQCQHLCHLLLDPRKIKNPALGQAYPTHYAVR